MTFRHWLWPWAKKRCSGPWAKKRCFRIWAKKRCYGDLVYKLRRVKGTPNFISSGSKIVKRLRRRQYDPLIIERTIGLVLGPSTTLYGPFLKHCTLTNKAVGTIWRALSKPPQRRQGPDLRPLWLLVGTPSAIRPELAFSRAEHSLPYSDVTIYIFAILYLSSTGHQAIIGHQQLSDTVGLYGVFLHTRESRQFRRGKGYRSKSQNTTK